MSDCMPLLTCHQSLAPASNLGTFGWLKNCKSTWDNKSRLLSCGGKLACHLSLPHCHWDCACQIKCVRESQSFLGPCLPPSQSGPANCLPICWSLLVHSVYSLQHLLFVLSLIVNITTYLLYIKLLLPLIINM